MKRTVVFFLVLVMLFHTPMITMAKEDDTPRSEISEKREDRMLRDAGRASDVKLSYRVHQQSLGNSAAAGNGEKAGTTGKGLRMEAFMLSCKLPKGVTGKITYRAHVQSVGWMGWKSNGRVAGSTGLAKRLEAIEIKLSGKLAKLYDVYYRTYMSNSGWFGWAKNGETSGTVGQSAVLEGIQVLVIRKDAKNPPRTDGVANLTSDNINKIWVSGHVQNYGDMPAVTNGAVFGTSGESKRLEGIVISMTHGKKELSGSLSYRVHAQSYGWMNEVAEGKYAGTKGESKRLEAISISLKGDITKYMDIYYRLHIETFGWLSWAKNGAYAGSTGMSKRAEAIQVMLVAKGASAPAGTSFSAYLEEANRKDLNVPLIYQNPELPYGCESVALTMVLNYYGYNLGKTAISDHWMIYDSNFMYGFNGSPYGLPGGCVYAPGLANTANRFLAAKGSLKRAHNLMGSDLASLYKYVSNGFPVIVWSTIDDDTAHYSSYSRAYNNQNYRLIMNLHCVVLTGYDKTAGTVKINDSLSGYRTYKKSTFEAIYNSMYKQAVVIY